MTFESLIVFLTIENNNPNIHNYRSIKSDRGSICNVLENSRWVTCVAHLAKMDMWNLERFREIKILKTTKSGGQGLCLS